MDVLLDTGVLLRLVNPADPQHVTVRNAVRILYQRGDSLVTTPQNIAEFWNVSTRPVQARGGLGRTLAETERCIRFSSRSAPFCPIIRPRTRNGSDS
jgi:predicted nucleic acid-binding protein